MDPGIAPENARRGADISKPASILAESGISQTAPDVSIIRTDCPGVSRRFVGPAIMGHIHLRNRSCGFPPVGLLAVYDSLHPVVAAFRFGRMNGIITIETM